MCKNGTLQQGQALHGPSSRQRRRRCPGEGETVSPSMDYVCSKNKKSVKAKAAAAMTRLASQGQGLDLPGLQLTCERRDHNNFMDYAPRHATIAAQPVTLGPGPAPTSRCFPPLSTHHAPRAASCCTSCGSSEIVPPARNVAKCSVAHRDAVCISGGIVASLAHGNAAQCRHAHPAVHARDRVGLHDGHRRFRH